MTHRRPTPQSVDARAICERAARKGRPEHTSSHCPQRRQQRRREARLPASALIAALVSGVLLAGCADPYDHGAGIYAQPVANTHTAGATLRSPDAPSTSAQSPFRAGPSDLDQGNTQSAGPSTAQQIAATLTARRFLAGYLPYTYGQQPASSIVDVAPALRAALTAAPPSVTPAQRALRPRLTDLAVNGGQHTQVSLLAGVDDGRETYTIPITVTEQPDGHWLVSAVS